MINAPFCHPYGSTQLYCQNLSLFGKLFIDVKTLFFDCDNCKDRVPSPDLQASNFYSFLLHTDGCGFATGPCIRIFLQGYFPTHISHLYQLTRSQEKYSYDDYNLACIIVLPPYQRKGYGMLMIEFSTSPFIHLADAIFTLHQVMNYLVEPEESAPQNDRCQT